jgi:hypothetical protein
MTVRSGYFFLMNREVRIIAGEAREGGGSRW